MRRNKPFFVFDLMMTVTLVLAFVMSMSLFFDGADSRYPLTLRLAQITAVSVGLTVVAFIVGAILITRDS